MSTFQRLLRRNAAIDIAVDYYGQEHRDALNAYPSVATIHSYAGGRMSVPIAEFLTYALFVNKRYQIPTLSTYAAIKAALNEHLGDFNAGLDTTPASLRTRLTGNEQLVGLSQKIGSAGALAVVSRFHGLSEADWDLLPVAQTRTHDYHYACCDHHHIQVEAKGTSICDNTGSRTSTIRGFATDIAAKKQTLRAVRANSAVVAYGVITAIDQRPDGVIQAWLLDPPPDAPLRPPREQRVLNRLRFITEILDVMMPSFVESRDLHSNLRRAGEARDVFALENHPLRGSPEQWTQAFFHAQTNDVDRHFSGTVFTLDDGSRFFYGMRRELLEVLRAQDFARLLRLQWPTTTSLTSLSVHPESGGPEGESQGGQTRSRRPLIEPAHVHMTSAGRVFGLIGPIEK